MKNRTHNEHLKTLFLSNSTTNTMKKPFWFHYYERNPLFDAIQFPLEPEPDIDDPAYRLNQREFLGNMTIKLYEAIKYCSKKQNSISESSY